VSDICIYMFEICLFEKSVLHVTLPRSVFSGFHHCTGRSEKTMNINQLFIF